MIDIHITANTPEELLEQLGKLAGRLQAPGVYATVSTVEVKPGTNIYSPFPEAAITQPGYLPTQQDWPPQDSPYQAPDPAPQQPQEIPQQPPLVEAPPAQQTAPEQPQQAGPTKDEVKVKAATWMRAGKDPAVTKSRMAQLQGALKKHGLVSMADLTDASVPALIEDLKALGVEI